MKRDITSKRILLIAKTKRDGLDWITDNKGYIHSEDIMIATNYAEFLHFYRRPVLVLFLEGSKEMIDYNRIEQIIAKNTKEG